MLFKKSSSNDENLPLDKVRFSRKDLFVLLGGFDTCSVAVNRENLNFRMILDKKPEKNEWLRNVIKRYHPMGLVDAQGNPNPELKRALDQLSQMGLTIANSTEELEREAGVVIGTLGACGVVKAPGIGGGWLIKPFPEDPSLWASYFRENIMDQRHYPFGPAAREFHATFVERPEEDFVQASIDGNEAYATAYAQRKGFDPAPFIEFAREVGKGISKYMCYVTDYSQFVPSYEYGWRLHEAGTGPFRARRAVVFPQIGAIMSECNSWHEGIPNDWTLDFERYRSATEFYSLDFYRSGDLFAALSSVPPYPGLSG